MFVHDILTRHHRALVTRAELRAHRRDGSTGSSVGDVDAAAGAGHSGAPVLLRQLAKAMLGDDHDIHRLGELAARHGEDLCRQGKPVAEVVHAYGDIGQALNGLARDLQLAVPDDQLWQVQGLLEDSLACALTAYERTRVPAAGRIAASARTFDHALRHQVQLARLALESSRLDHDLDASLIAGPLGRSIHGLIALLAQRDARERDAAAQTASTGP